MLKLSILPVYYLHAPVRFDRAC